MKTLVLLASLMLSTSSASAAEYTCGMWNLNSEKEKLIFAAGYQAGVNLAVKVAQLSWASLRRRMSNMSPLIAPLFLVERPEVWHIQLASIVKTSPLRT